MMKTTCPKFGLLFMITIVLACIAATPAFALFGGKIDNFSADNVTIDENGSIVNTAKLYVNKDAIRIDGISAAGVGGKKLNLSMLILKNHKKSYFYNHDKKLVFEGPLDEKDMMAGYKAMDNVESEKVLGKEKVSRYKCVKKEVVTSTQIMGQNMKTRLIVWESDKFEMPLKTMDEDGAIQEMRNIKEGKPPKKMMQPLTGYKKVGNMMAVMGMDLGEMMAQGQAMGEEEEAQTRPELTKTLGKKKPAAKKLSSQQNLDVNKMMEQMNQAMGDNMSPEEKTQFMQTMAQVMNRVKETKEGPGSAEQIWQIIPRRSGDKVGAELKTTNVLNVTMGTKATLTDVFYFYKEKLTDKGWKDQGMYLQNGQGSLSLVKGELRLTISSAENPGIKGNYSNFYMMQLHGPDI